MTEEEKPVDPAPEGEPKEPTEEPTGDIPAEGTEAPKADDAPPEKELVFESPPEIAPGVPRMATPTGAASTSPDVAPGYGFLTVVSLLSLVADLATKVWAKERLETFPGYVQVFEKHLSQGVAGMSFILAHNKGGAWGLLQGTNENVRKPFFLLVSAAAIAFIVTLFRRLQPNQRALKWGLPLVLGGALGNVFDRIRYGSVIDFIDVHLEKGGVDHHWPTFNVADIAICVGVGLMAVDMFTAKRQTVPRKRRPPPIAITELATEPAVPSEEPPAEETKPEEAKQDVDEKPMTATPPEANPPSGDGDQAKE